MPLGVRNFTGADGVTAVQLATDPDAANEEVVLHSLAFLIGSIATRVDKNNRLPVAPFVPVTTAQLPHSTNTTAGKFDVALHAPAPGTRRYGGRIYNKSPFDMSIYHGAVEDADDANAIPLPAGESVSCSEGGVVLQDQVCIACAGQVSQPYVTTEQSLQA